MDFCDDRASMDCRGNRACMDCRDNRACMDCRDNRACMDCRDEPYLYYNLSLLANSRSQFLLDCLGRCLKLFISTDSTSSHEFASQFGLAIFLYAKNTQKLSRRPSPVQVFVECAGHGRSIASDNMSSNNSDHSGERLSQNGDNESLYLQDLKNVV